MCGFDSGFGEEINNSIIRSFPSSIELSFYENNFLKMTGIESNSKLIFKNDIQEWELIKYPTRINFANEKKSILNLMYYQMILNQKHILQLPLKICQFILKYEKQERIKIGIELLFIQSLVYIEKKTQKSSLPLVSNEESSKQKIDYEGEFGFVINFDKENVHILTPFPFDSQKNSFFKIYKSSLLCLDLDQTVINNFHPHKQLDQSKDLNLPFKGLQLPKKISTKLRKKISKRKNIS